MPERQPIEPRTHPSKDPIEARRNDRAFQARTKRMMEEERAVLEQLAK
jgi:hypothetical protein